MTHASYGPEWAKREALRRRMRALGVSVVPAPGVLDRIAAEHAEAARLGREGHDDLCERTYVAPFGLSPCYCPERRDALDRIARRLDAATSNPLTFDQSVTSEQTLGEEGPR